MTNGTREPSDNTVRERLAIRNNNAPISIKLRKTGNDEAVSRSNREAQRFDRLKQNESGKSSRREPPPIEIGPKRLKVKGPSNLGLESRLH